MNLVSNLRRLRGVASLTILTGSLTASAATGSNGIMLEPGSNVSLRNEVQHAIDRGLAWLDEKQNTNGFWSSPEHPAMTALVLDAYEGRPDSDAKSEPPAVRKGYGFLMSCVQNDGGIYRKELPSYNTSVSLMAILLRNRAEDNPIIAQARKFLIGMQVETGDSTNASNGGIGYGGEGREPDLSNTEMALEALYFSKRAVQDSAAPAPDLNWKAAIGFVSRCQNLPASNPEPWASGDPENKGGFVYAPGRSMAGETNLPSGRVALRSYGSMSYAGLLSYAYADLKPDDPRVTAVKEWLRANYSVDENPEMGQQGVYYYYFVMAKALTLEAPALLETKGGKTVNWRQELALKLINLQGADGSWTNSDGRWWERDPVLDTAFTVIALDLTYRKL
jgi:squalene-hopene/tetraprenyl-beta-curcumene cyclase